MNWKSLFTPVKSLDAAQTQEFMSKHAVDDFQLLDVRQPREYEESHLPGSQLIPIKELPGRLDELDKEKPVVVYCATGGRSRAASQLLVGSGFQEVYNVSGGIKAWEGRKVSGPYTAGLELLSDRDDFPDALLLAYAMEDGLQQFYLQLEGEAEAEEHRRLCRQLAGLEEKHKERLRKAYGEEADLKAQADPLQETLLEGGANPEKLLATARSLLTSRADILELAMMIELQAFDLYKRLAQKTVEARTKELFLQLAEEEKTHLGFLSGELDKVLEK